MISKTLTSRQKQAIKTKNHIFETAMKLGMERGFETLEINDICTACKISVGTFYHYFRSLDAIFQEQYIAYDTYFEDALQNSPLMGNPTEQIIQLFSLKYDYVAERGVQFIVRQYRGQFQQIDTANSFFFSKDRVMYQSLRTIIQDGIKKGELMSDVSIDFLCDSLLVFSRGITIDWALQNGCYDLKQVALSRIHLIIRQFVVPSESSTFSNANLVLQLDS